MNPDSRVVLIAGGASGLGAATARRLVAQGARVMLADLQMDAAQALANSLPEGCAGAVRCDVCSESEVQAGIDAAVARFGSLDVAVNCAGIATGEKVLGRDGPHRLDSFARTIQINLVGSFNLLRLAAAQMARQPANADGERGVLINTASIAAFDGQIGQAAYAASKAGVVGMTLPIARELARHGIRCMTIAPGLFATPMMAGLPEDVQASLGASVPFPPRLGNPDEYARLVQQIIENPMLNGECIRLDGALRMAAK